jgi:GntR family transcriptional regulator
MTVGTEAKWETIARRIRTQITQGELRPGDQVPSEIALAQQFGYARGTARVALQALEDAGVLVPGRPRRVAQYQRLVIHVTRTSDRLDVGESPTLGADSWLWDARAAGYVADQRVAMTTTSAAGEVARWLEVPVGAIVINRRNIRLVGDSPHNVINYWFPPEIAEGTPLAEKANITEGSLAWLDREHGPLTHRVRMRSRMPSPEEAGLLRILAGVPVFEVWRTSRNSHRILVVSRAIYPADRTELELAL